MQYFSASDASVFIEGPSGKRIQIDKADGIQLSSSRRITPVYSLGNPEYAFLATGNVIAEGFLEINFIHESYLIKALDYVSGNIDAAIEVPENTTQAEWNSMSSEEMMKMAESQEKSYNNGRYSTASIVYMNDPVSIILEFNLNKYGDGSKRSEVVIEGCRFISESIGASIKNEGNIKEGYSFIGKRKR